MRGWFYPKILNLFNKKFLLIFSHKKSNCSLDETNTSFFSKNKTRKSGGNLPIPIHTRTVSSPVPLISETTCSDPVPFQHKRFPSVDQRTVPSLSDRISFKTDSKKLSLDSCLSPEKFPKRTSSDISDKHSKKNSYVDKNNPKRSLDEMRLSTRTSSERSFILNTPETPSTPILPTTPSLNKGVAATPELLAELLRGSSERLVNEQHQTNNHHNIFNSSGGIALPSAVLKFLVRPYYCLLIYLRTIQ